MRILIHKSANDYIDFSGEFSDTRDIFNYIKHQISEELSDSILNKPHTFVGFTGTEFKPLTAETLFNDIQLYSELYIVPELEGDDPISATIAAMAAYAGGMAATAAGVMSTALGFGALSSAVATGIITTVATVVEVGISIGISAAISAVLTPDSNVSGDAAAAQKTSKIFNSAAIIREQGGSVPLTYGNPFCGGVLISSGLTSKDVKV